MKINFLTPRFFPAISGGEFYIQNLAETMLKHFQDDIHVVCSNAIDFKALKDINGMHLSSDHPCFQQYRNIPINRLNLSYDYLKNRTMLQTAVKYLKRYLDENSLNISQDTVSYFLENGCNMNEFITKFANSRLTQNKPDIIHSTYLPYSPILYGLLLAKINRIPAITTPFYHIFNPRYDQKYFIEVLQEYDGIIACTEYEKNYLVSKGLNAKKISVLPMGVDFELYNQPVKSKSGKIKSFSKSFDLKRPFILFCGYKNYEKGAISLLHSIPIIHKTHQNLNFVFIGPTTQAFDIELRKTRAQHINILNLTPGNMTGYYDWRKISAFQECSLFIMPSRSDAYGMVYLEAWAAGKPVIGAKTPVMEEIIQHNKDGLLVEFDNIDEISDAILHLLNNPNLASKMGKNGLKKVQNNNNWIDITSKTRRFYEGLIEKCV